MKFDIVASVVLYKNSIEQLEAVADSFLNTTLKIKLYIIDNSPTDVLRTVINDRANAEYIFSGSNLGYSKGHNLAMRKSLDSCAYYVVSNPDISFHSGMLEKLFYFMETNNDVGLVVPKMLYPDGSIQYLCKLLPTPIDLIFRRFLPFRKYVEQRNEKYELRFTDYDKIMNIPYLSGSFMFVRAEALKKVGFFDERIFMYLEDLDLSRRIHRRYKTVYFPDAHVYHGYEKASYIDARLLRYHMRSAITYFNKWGWLFDAERSAINRKTLEELTAYKTKGEKA